MTLTGPLHLYFLLVACLITMPVDSTTAHQSTPSPDPTKQDELGTVDFPTSTRSREAQAHFLRGVAALHSFWYPVALEEFRAATKIDPDFAMGYWGEAMVQNHPLWGDPQETEAARRALARITMTPELTARERAYIEAVTVLYGEGSKSSRDRAYARAMQKVYRDYPGDIEAALFYALALLGSAGDGLQGSQKRLLAGMIASTVFGQQPHHPGAAHYVIHEYDNPKDAHPPISSSSWACGRKQSHRTWRLGRRRTHGSCRTGIRRANAIIIACSGCSTPTCNWVGTKKPRAYWTP